MEQNNKFFVYDSYVFAFKNALANIRIITLAFVSWLIALIPLGIISIAVYRTSLVAIATAPAGARAALVVNQLVQGSGTGILLTILIAFLFFSWVGIGLVRIGLRIHDTGTADMSTIFPSPLLIIKAFFGVLLFITVMLLGLLCFVIPGIYFGIRAWFYIYAIADGEGVFEAFSTSFRMTRGKGWQIYAFLIATVILSASTVFLGSLISVLANAYAYRLLKKSA